MLKNESPGGPNRGKESINTNDERTMPKSGLNVKVSAKDVINGLQDFAVEAVKRRLHPILCDLKEKKPVYERKSSGDAVPTEAHIMGWRGDAVALVCGESANPVLAVNGHPYSAKPWAP